MSRKLVSISLASTLLGGTALADVPDVVADIAPVHSLVARVMEGVGSPNLIVAQGASPHEYSLRPSEAAALQDADLVFWIGEDLTPWLDEAVETLANNADITTLMETEGTILLDFRKDVLFEAHSHDDHDDHAGEKAHDHEKDHDHAEHTGEHDHDAHDHDHDAHDHADHAKEKAHDDHDGHDHAEYTHDDHDHAEHAHEDHDEHGHDDHDADDHAGHDHGAHDPHVWLSTANAANWLNLIAAELSAADPGNAGAYYANAAAARAEIDTLNAAVDEILSPVRGQSFVVFHDAYQYFETTYDFPASGAISLSDASDPSPARIAEIQGRVQTEAVTCVLAEPQFNPGIVTTVLDGTTAITGVIDPLGVDLEPGPSLYPKLIQNMATTLAGCLTPGQ
ncbi:MAG: zinc ABC transporter substrate-binding protein [Roseobacter sp.]